MNVWYKYLEIVEHGLLDMANIVRSCLQVVDGVKHNFHSLVCNPVGCQEQKVKKTANCRESLLTKKDSAQDQLEVTAQSVNDSQ